jgi:hypothetical protein
MVLIGAINALSTTTRMTGETDPHVAPSANLQSRCRLRWQNSEDHLALPLQMVPMN